MSADSVSADNEAQKSVFIVLTRLKTCSESTFGAGIDDWGQGSIRYDTSSHPEGIP